MPSKIFANRYSKDILLLKRMYFNEIKEEFEMMKAYAGMSLFR